MHYLSATLTTWQTVATDRLGTALADDRGDGPTDNGLLIAGGVAAAVAVVGAVSAAVASAVGKIN